MGTQSNEFEKLELFYAPLEETAQANLPSMAGTQENKDSAKSSAGKTDGRCLTKIVIAADHTLTRLGLRALFEQVSGFTVTEVEADPEQILHIVRERPLNILVTEMRFTGEDVSPDIRSASRTVPVMAFSAYWIQESFHLALECGVRGFMTKDADVEEIVKSARTVANGGTYIDPRLSTQLVERRLTCELTERETDVLRFIATGHTTSEVSQRLHISNRTTESVRSALKQKLGLTTRAQMHTYACENGYLATTCSCSDGTNEKTPLLRPATRALPPRPEGTH